MKALKFIIKAELTFMGIIGNLVVLFFVKIGLWIKKENKRIKKEMYANQ